MADDLDPVTQQFIADTAEYTAELEEAAATAQEFAAVNEEVTLALDGVRDHAAEAGAAFGSIRDGAAEASAADGSLRDSAAETATALGHLRDEAIEAAAAMHELRDSEVEAGAAGAAAEGGGLSMMVVGMVALVGAAAAVAPAVLAAGAGMGAFGLFALPALKSVSTAYTQISADQQAYNRALTASARNTALAHLKADYASLSPAQRGAVEGVQQLAGEYRQLSAAFQPEAFSLLNQALKIASDLLPKLVPLAQAGGQALQGLMGAAGKGLDSKGFSDFLSMLTSLVVPATRALTQLAATVTGILGQAITQLAPMSVPFIQMLNGLLAAAGPGLVGALRLIAQTLLDIGHAITPLIGPLAAVLSFMGQHPVFAQMATVILAVVAAVRLWAVAQGILDAVLTANPIGLVIAAIALLVIGIVELVTHWKTVEAALKAGFGVVAAAGVGLWHMLDSGLIQPIERGFAAVVSFVEAHWRLLATILATVLLGPVGGLVVFLATHWRQVSADAYRVVSDVTSFFRQLPGRVMSAVASLPGQMLSFGESIVNGLLQGVESAAGGLLSEVSSLAGDVSHAFSSVLGIFSPSRVFYGHMVNTVQGAIDGWKSRVPELLATVRGTAAGIAGAGSSLAASAIAPAAGSSSVHVSVPMTVQGSAGALYADPRFQQYLQEQVQEATLRYGQLNPGNGLTSGWGR